MGTSASSPSDLFSVGFSFWKQQALRFGGLRQEAVRHARLRIGATYHPEGWNLDDVGASRDIAANRWCLDHGMPQTIAAFRSIAAVCAVALGVPNTDLAWVEWLDCLRRDSGEFKQAELSLDWRAVERRPEPDVEIVVTGLIQQPTEERPDPDSAIVSTELGEIDDVCGASERLCRRLADETLRVEIQQATGSRGRSPSAATNRAGWTITQPWEAEFAPQGFSAQFPQMVGLPAGAAGHRSGVVAPLLTARGWSTLDWAKEAKVDYNTANNYLNGSTTPRRDTLKKLAHALGLDPGVMPI